MNELQQRAICFGLLPHFISSSTIARRCERDHITDREQDTTLLTALFGSAVVPVAQMGFKPTSRH